MCAKVVLFILSVTYAPWLAAAENPSGRVAFIRGTEVFMADLRGGSLTQLTQDGLDKRDLRWSPDGRRLAFALKAGRGEALGRLAVMEVESRKTHSFLYRPASASVVGMNFIGELFWLDVRRIAITGGINPNNCEYVVLDAGTGEELTGAVGLCGSFSVSPDGQHVAYTCAPGVGAPETDWRQCVEFDREVRAYTPPSPRGRLLTDPVWSGDSSRIAVLEHDLQTTAKTVVIVSLDRQITRIPLPATFQVPMELRWVENRLTLRAEGTTFLVDSAAKALRSPGLDVEEAMQRQDRAKEEQRAARRRAIGLALKLGATREEDIGVYLPETDPGQ